MMKNWRKHLRYKLARRICPEIFADFEDMEERLSKILDFATGGKLSKAFYTLITMEQAINEYNQKCCRECKDLAKMDGGK